MLASENWTANPQTLALKSEQIHIWRARIDSAEIDVQRLEGVLAADEKTRANRFVFPRDRSAYVATRGILRQLLGKYAKVAPSDLHFEYHARGKPFLSSHSLGRSVKFNVSHSNGMAVFAFTSNSEVGIDVEMVKYDVECEEIAHRYFSREEIAELNSLSPDLRPLGFFLCWTRKEAYLKAKGEGLGIPLDRFQVSLTPGTPSRLVSADSSLWSLFSFDVESNYAAACVTENRGLQPRYFDWIPGQESTTSEKIGNR